MQCISTVLQQEEELRHPALTPAAAPGSPAVLITNGSFAWEAGGIPLLRHISLEIPAGRLLIVIGEVGSGERSAAGVGAIHIAYTSGIKSARHLQTFNQSRPNTSKYACTLHIITDTFDVCLCH